MKVSVKYILLFLTEFLISLFASKTLQAASNNVPSSEYIFDHISSKNGLTGNIVRAIYKDKRGYMWFGLENSLNCYDGYNIKVFRHNPLDTNSLSSGAVCSIKEDASGNLWIATKDGACIYNYKTETFQKHFDAVKFNAFNRAFYLTRNNDFLLITTNGIYALDNKKFNFKSYLTDTIFKSATQIIEDQNGTFIIGTWGDGLIILSKNHKDYTIKKIGTTHQNEENIFEALYSDKKHNIWIANQLSLYKGTTCYINGKPDINLEVYPLQNVSLTRKSNSAIHCISEDWSGNIWIGTESGLRIIKAGSHKVDYVLSETDNNQSLSIDVVNCIYADDNMWIGTYQGGINIYSRTLNRFARKFPYINSNQDPLIRYVKSVIQDSFKNTIIGTDKGIVVYNEQNKLSKVYFHSNDPGSIQAGGVTAIYIDREKHTWVGTWGGGLSLLDSKKGKFEYFLKYNGSNFFDDSYTADANVFAITEDSKGNIWIGYMFGIIDCFNKISKKFAHYNIGRSVNKPNMTMRSMVIDKNDVIWIGASAGGLIQFNTNTREAKLINEKISNSSLTLSKIGSEVYSLQLDRNQNLWLGTGSGLGFYNKYNKEYKLYGSEYGLPSSTINSIILDENQDVWLSTLKGISHFDVKNHIFVNFDATDGVPLNSETSYKGLKNQLFFGGYDGIMMFYPDSMFQNQEVPPIVFTDFKLFNQSVPAGSKILPYSINETPEIILAHSQNVFSIEMAALNYNQPQKNTYRCYLEGFDKDWITLGSAHEARYTNLNPGTYYFKVKAANNDGKWNNHEHVLKIVIKPPWWSAWFFRLFIAIFLSCLIIYYISWRTNNLKKQNIKLELKVKKRTEEIALQQEILKVQATELMETNTLLVENQKEIKSQKEAIEHQNAKLENKNKLLEEQNHQILNQKAQVEEMSVKLHLADQMKLRFFSNVSHEFRTPLSLISGPLEKIMQEIDPKTAAPIWPKLQLMYRNTQRLMRLINQFLDLSKIEAGEMGLHVSTGNAANFIENIIESYRFLADQKNIQLRFVARDENYNCYFDPDKLDKILFNLLSNSFKYTPVNGSITVRLKIICKKDEVSNEGVNCLSIEVEDTGYGIPKKYLNKIFERFYQIEDKAGTSSGTGIGLALTHELIEIYRGSISVFSEEGLGTQFEILLPCESKSFKVEEIVDQVIRINEYKMNALQLENKFDLNDHLSVEIPKIDHSNKKLILIVEDNIDTITYLNDQLKHDFIIELAHDGKQGYEKAIALLPKAIISDIMMPNINGLQLCQMLKSDDRTCHIPILLLTAKADSSDQKEGIEYGADEYITKPFDIDLLRLKIHNIINTREKLKRFYWQKGTLTPSDVTIDSADEKLLQKVMKTIEEKLSDPAFSVDELSRIVGLSRTHLYRKTTEITQQTPIELIRNTRLQVAGQLLKQNKFYISEIMYMTGFQEISYFRKIFKEFYGASPSEFVVKNVVPSDK